MIVQWLNNGVWNQATMSTPGCDLWTSVILRACAASDGTNMMQLPPHFKVGVYGLNRMLGTESNAWQLSPWKCSGWGSGKKATENTPRFVLRRATKFGKEGETEKEYVTDINQLVWESPMRANEWDFNKTFTWLMGFVEEATDVRCWRPDPE